MRRNSLAEIIQAFQRGRSVAVISHISPEADTLGSALAAYLVLRKMGKEVALFNADPIPQRYRFLPGAEEIVRCDRIPRPFEIYLVVDSSDRERAGGLLQDLPPQGLVINIDHHPSNEGFGNLNWVEAGASSTGEMVFRLFKEMGVPIPPEAATNLYAAILIDTGSFRFSNTTPSALRAAAELIELGADPQEIAHQLYDYQDPRSLRLLGKVLSEMAVSQDGAVAHIVIRRADVEAAGIGMDETEEFINYPRSLKGVKVALAFKETTKDVIKVSFRSRGPVDVAQIASLFQGGGHKNAAGCLLSGDLGEVKERVLAEVRRALNRTGSMPDDRCSGK